MIKMLTWLQLHIVMRSMVTCHMMLALTLDDDGPIYTGVSTDSCGGSNKILKNSIEEVDSRVEDLVEGRE